MNKFAQVLYSFNLVNKESRIDLIGVFLYGSMVLNIMAGPQSAYVFLSGLNLAVYSFIKYLEFKRDQLSVDNSQLEELKRDLNKAKHSINALKAQSEFKR